MTQGGALAKKSAALFTEPMRWLEEQFRAGGHEKDSRELAVHFFSCPSPKVYARLEALTAARYLDSLRANPVISMWGASLLVKNSSTAGFRRGDALHSPDFSPGHQSLGSSIVPMM